MLHLGSPFPAFVIWGKNLCPWIYCCCHYYSGRVCACECRYTRRSEVLDPSWTGVVSHPTWVLENKRVLCTSMSFYLQAISSVPWSWKFYVKIGTLTCYSHRAIRADICKVLHTTFGTIHHRKERVAYSFFLAVNAASRVGTLLPLRG